MKKPEPGEIQQILADYQPERTPISESLGPWRELIEGLHRRRASLRVIVQILKNRNVQCSESSLLRYLRDSGIQPPKNSPRRTKPRRRHEETARGNRQTDMPDNLTGQTDQPHPSGVTEGKPASNGPAENREPTANRTQPSENPQPLLPRPADSTGDRVRKRGPRIAQIKLLDDSEL